MEFRIIGQKDEQSLLLKNEAFSLFGEMIVERERGKWSYEIKKYEQAAIKQQTFPDEAYQLKEINQNGFAIAAVDNEQTIGLAIFDNQWHHYAYLRDLKVNKNYRRKGVSHSLLQLAQEVAKANGHQGFWTIGQNNNLAACQFYLNYGFEIGGLDTNVYNHTSESGKQDIHFYYDFL